MAKKTYGWVADLGRLFNGRKLVSARDEAMVDARADLEDSGLMVPEELLMFCGSIEDGFDRIDLSAQGGSASQDLCDAFGLLEENDPSSGTWGGLVAEGAIPEGALLFGYGAWQLVWDAVGAWGEIGAIWLLQDMLAETRRPLAPNLTALLAAAKPADSDV